MAKVKIQGNASGTGVLTITAPNTSTDRVITLPDATATLATTADSVGGANGVDFNDDVKARFGTGNDLEIYHDGTDSYIHDSGSGNLELRTNGVQIGIMAINGSEYMGKFVQGNQVELYYNNSKKFETTATGIAVTGGVAIGGTGAANTLDDYEEGTWTASLQGANQSGMNTTGYYTKIGRQVFFQWYSGGMTISSASGPAKVTGLPFTSSNASSAYGLFIYLHGNGVDGGSTGGYVQDVDTTFRFVDTNNITDASYVNGTKYIMVSGSYFVS